MGRQGSLCLCLRWLFVAIALSEPGAANGVVSGTGSSRYCGGTARPDWILYGLSSIYQYVNTSLCEFKSRAFYATTLVGDDGEKFWALTGVHSLSETVNAVCCPVHKEADVCVVLWSRRKTVSASSSRTRRTCGVKPCSMLLNAAGGESVG
jgi:hypothetical protein